MIDENMIDSIAGKNIYDIRRLIYFESAQGQLVHWGLVTHVCIIGTDNGLSPGRPMLQFC